MPQSQSRAATVHSRDTFSVNKHVTIKVQLKGQSGSCHVLVTDHRSNVVFMKTLCMSVYCSLVDFFEKNTSPQAIEEAAERFV